MDFHPRHGLLLVSWSVLPKISPLSFALLVCTHHSSPDVIHPPSVSSPRSTLDWRLLQWLSAGSEMVEPQLHRISYPVLVVAGTVDRLLPSYEEAKRLQRELPTCTVHYASEWLADGCSGD